MPTLDDAQTLLATVSGWPRPIFVLLDGAKLADIDGSLGRLGITARPLFIHPSNPALVRAGPWLAMLDDSRLRALMQAGHLSGELVLWGGVVGEQAAVRHFRGLNLIEMPRQTPGVPGRQVALFRHYDPDVLAVVYPALDPAQRARLFGPFSALLLHSPRPGAKRLAMRQPDWPQPSRRWLRFSPEQIAGITGSMTGRSHQAIAAYLRTTAPDRTGALDEADLLEHVAESEQSGRALGLSSEQGLGRWSYLMLVSEGRIARSEPARVYIQTGPGSPDQNISVLMKAIAGTLHEREQAAV